MVPGSTLRYGSNFCRETFRPRLSIRQPIDAAASPLPSEDTTPPVTKMYFAAMPSSVVGICAARGTAPTAPENREPLALADQRNQGGVCRGARSIMAGFLCDDKSSWGHLVNKSIPVRNSRSHSHFLSAIALADRNTASNIAAVSFPVAVF